MPQARGRRHGANVTGKVTYGARAHQRLPRHDRARRDRLATASSPAAPTPLADGSFPTSRWRRAKYRIQILHLCFLTMTDTQRDPLTLKAQRRAHLGGVQGERVARRLIPSKMGVPRLCRPSPPTGTATLLTTLALHRHRRERPGRASGNLQHSQTARARASATRGTRRPYGTAATSVSFHWHVQHRAGHRDDGEDTKAYFWGTWQELDSTAPAMWTGGEHGLPDHLELSLLTSGIHAGYGLCHRR